MQGPDWEAPWYAPWRGSGRAAQERMSAGMGLAAALTAHPGAALRFVPQAAPMAAVDYARRILHEGECPVRDGLHDFLNGLVWLQFPRSKAALNAVHACALPAGRARGPERDAATVFDENGALLDAPDAIWEALAAHDWRRLFVDLRPLWSEARLLVFGHGLLEQLAAPRKGLTAHVWRASCPWLAHDLALADEWLAARCTADALAAKPFTPLPVLGVPGWWAPNTNFSFYDDSQVFRPRKTQRQQQEPAMCAWPRARS